MNGSRVTPIRAEQVGSLLRPPALLAARAAFADGGLDLSSLRAKEDEAIRAAVARQREIGLDVLADGQKVEATGFEKTSAREARGHLAVKLPRSDTTVSLIAHAGDLTSAPVSVKDRPIVLTQ